MEREKLGLPWEWEAGDSGMITLGTVGDAVGMGHVLTCHVCAACEISGNRCMLPDPEKANFILRAVNNHHQLLEALKDLAIAADTAEIFLRPSHNGFAESLRLKVTKALQAIADAEKE